MIEIQKLPIRSYFIEYCTIWKKDLLNYFSTFLIMNRPNRPVFPWNTFHINTYVERVFAFNAKIKYFVESLQKGL